MPTKTHVTANRRFSKESVVYICSFMPMRCKQRLITELQVGKFTIDFGELSEAELDWFEQWTPNLNRHGLDVIHRIH